jgi:hypothetical protein
MTKPKDNRRLDHLVRAVAEKCLLPNFRFSEDITTSCYFKDLGKADDGSYRRYLLPCRSAFVRTDVTMPLLCTMHAPELGLQLV